ncbi:zinc finger protein ZFP2-like [Ornithodoros turicata]|uniref:zinc finger protein ZFP2-like n=1 Tax=Ornithodoros turicata TaxID=34597 RepID=UPI003138C349
MQVRRDQVHLKKCQCSAVVCPEPRDLKKHMLMHREVKAIRMQSVSLGAGESTDTLHIKDKPRGTCEQEYSGCSSSYAQFKISTTIVELQPDSTALFTMNDQLTERHRNQSKPCALASTSKTSLECHMFSHCHNESEKCSTPPTNIQMGEKGSGCNIYPAAFSWYGSDKNHVVKHTDKRPHKSDVCPAEFSLSGNIQQHKRTDSCKKPHKCDECPAQFSRSAHLQQHKRIHTGDKPYKCDVCHAEFSLRGNLQQHKRTHTGEKPYKCHVCHTEFSLRGNLQQHKRTHTGARESTGTLHIKDKPRGTRDQVSPGCTFSNARFEISRATVEARLNNTAVVTMEDPATERPPEKSKSCGLACTSKARLQHHMFAHCLNESEKCPATPPPNVQMGEEEFIQGTHLQRHKMMHTGENPWKCDLCPAQFNRNAHLRLHKRTHNGEKPYKCDVCPAKFRRSSDMQRHKRTRTGEKPYKCDVCPAKFSRSSSDRASTYSITSGHTWGSSHKSGTSVPQNSATAWDEKSYRSTLCLANSRHITNLQLYRRTSMGVKPQKCNLCPAGFSHSTNTHYPENKLPAERQFPQREREPQA